MQSLRIAVAATAFVFAGTLPSNAATRNCTADERELGNERLAEIAADDDIQARLIDWHLKFGMPEATGPAANERILVQGGYVMDHDDDLRTALWVGYRLTAKDQIDAEGKDRVNCFRQDPRMGAAVTGVLSDYEEPRFDRGHMANDADLKDDITEQVNSYVMSNMSPQECRFNRGIWLSLEDLTRTWASEYDTIFVTSGAIFDRDGDRERDDDGDAERMLSNNDKSRVAVPSHYYKIMLRWDDDGYKSIAFLLAHTNDEHGTAWADVRPHVGDAIITIEDIEDSADIRLFPDLDRSVITQSVSGEGWNLDDGGSNFEGSCG